jgi:hypothetical protein
MKKGLTHTNHYLHEDLQMDDTSLDIFENGATKQHK